MQEHGWTLRTISMWWLLIFCLSVNLFSELQISTSDIQLPPSLPDISTWLSNWHLWLKMSNTNWFLPILHFLQTLLSRLRISPFTYLPRPKTLEPSWIPLILSHPIFKASTDPVSFIFETYWEYNHLLLPLLLPYPGPNHTIIFCLDYCNGLLIDPHACIQCGRFSTQQPDSLSPSAQTFPSASHLIQSFHFLQEPTPRPMLPLTIHSPQPPCFSPVASLLVFWHIKQTSTLGYLYQLLCLQCSFLGNHIAFFLPSFNSCLVSPSLNVCNNSPSVVVLKYFHEIFDIPPFNR